MFDQALSRPTDREAAALPEFAGDVERRPIAL